MAKLLQAFLLVYCIALSCAVRSVEANKVVDLPHIEVAVKVGLVHLQTPRKLILLAVEHGAILLHSVPHASKDLSRHLLPETDLFESTTSHHLRRRHGDLDRQCCNVPVCRVPMRLLSQHRRVSLQTTLRQVRGRFHRAGDKPHARDRGGLDRLDLYPAAGVHILADSEVSGPES
jgi:hypothetical protein